MNNVRPLVGDIFKSRWAFPESYANLFPDSGRSADNGRRLAAGGQPGGPANGPPDELLTFAE
jgi:hypothetical protein